MSWIQKILPRTQTSTKGNVPEGIWSKCGSCQAVLYKTELEKLQEVCPKCDHHMRITARRRIDAFLDEGDRVELGSEHEPQRQTNKRLTTDVELLPRRRGRAVP